MAAQCKECEKEAGTNWECALCRATPHADGKTLEAMHAESHTAYRAFCRANAALEAAHAAGTGVEEAEAEAAKAKAEHLNKSKAFANRCK